MSKVSDSDTRVRERRLRAQESPLLVLTIGHSTHSIEEFIGLIEAHSVKRIVDVRTIPRSRRNPQFNSETLRASLHSAGIDYVPMPELGGLRHPSKNSINSGWRNTSVRGYADHMQTSEFQQAIDRLIQLAGHGRIAAMCAEAVPWRCHRSLIADALLVRGIPSEDITSRTRRQPHVLTPFARVEGLRITYPAYAASREMSFVETSPKKSTGLASRPKQKKS
jgi:uncharacterized protein (DUF488 family)